MKTLVLALALLAPVAANATTVAQHHGSTDPSTEGWYYITTGDGTTTSGGTETTPSGEHHFWNVQDATIHGGSSWYFDISSAQFASDWRFQVNARVIDSPIVPGYPDVPGTGLIVRDGTNYWSFYLGNDFVGPMGNAGTLAAKHYLNTRDDYHSYVIAVSHNGAGAADDTADFYVDGALVFAGIPRSVLYASVDQLVNFGPDSTNGTSNVNYELVRFDVPDATGDACSDDEGDHDDGDHGDGNHGEGDHGSGEAHDSAGMSRGVPAARIAARRAPELAVAKRTAAGCDVAGTGSPAALLGLAGVAMALLRRRAQP